MFRRPLTVREPLLVCEQHCNLLIEPCTFFRVGLDIYVVKGRRLHQDIKHNPFKVQGA